ncbi:unnamed protein product [Brachionus calyciflorus]|uniref:COX assembly mitochondrial protein n=1 Tax=Brachionus calyciflorus TaxID=104777 RepID=A0A813NSD5_9BILA|nr:unnamed protein product [Brachionus calyciflorus]
MHPNLAKHLHCEECVQLIEEYEKCNKENKYMRYMGVCSDIQYKMTACIQKELRDRRNIGGENLKKKELENYAKKNPEFAAKLKLYEELKAKEQNQKNQPS